MVNTLREDTTTDDLESFVRKTLAFGEISTAAEAKLNHLARQGNVSPRDEMLLAILRDAIQDGCIRRVESI